MTPLESGARADTNKPARHVRRPRPKGIIEANRKTEMCNHWLRGECPFGAKCAFAHGAHELRPVGDSHGAGKMNTLHLQSGSESHADRSTTVHRPTPQRGHGNNAGNANNNNTLRSSPASMFAASVGCPGQRSPLQEIDSNSQGRVEQGRRGLLPPWECPIAILQSSSLGWACPTVSASSTTVGVKGAARLSAFHSTNVTTTTTTSDINGSHSYSAAPMSAATDAAPVLCERETWANVVARREPRRSFSATADPSSSASTPMPMPMPMPIPGNVGDGVSGCSSSSSLSKSSSSSSSASMPFSSSACGRKDCPCCASHAAAAAAACGSGPGLDPAALATFFGRHSAPARASANGEFSLLGRSAVAPATVESPSSSSSAASSAAPANAKANALVTIPTSQSPKPGAGSASSATSSSPPSSLSRSASRWNWTAHDGNALLVAATPAGAAQVSTKTKPIAPPVGAERPRRPARSSGSCGEDSNQAVARMMAALSLDSCFKGEGGDGDGDGDGHNEEDDDELVALSTKPAPWDALPSSLLTEGEAEEEGPAFSETAERRSGGTPERYSLLPGRALRLSNSSLRSVHGPSTLFSSDRGTGDSGMGLLPGFREQRTIAPSWTTSPEDKVWQPRLPNVAPSSKDGLFQVVTPTPGFDFGWGRLDSSSAGLS
eukprot:g10640.t1